MNLEAKITAAVRCLEREYPKGVPPALQELVESEVTREHYAEFRQRLGAWFREYLDVSVTVARLMQLGRTGSARRAPDHSQIA
jgi:hypothetical protein